MSYSPTLIYTSLSKANGIYHEIFYSLSNATSFLPNTKKHTVLKHYMSYPSPLAQLSTTLKAKGDPRGASDKIPSHLVSNFLFSICQLSSYFSSHYSMTHDRANMSASTDEKRETPPVKTGMLTGVGQVTVLFSDG